MRDIKCKDYFILKVNDYTYIKDDHHGNMERAKAFYDFKWALVEYVTGKDNEWWIWTHMLQTIECAFEEMDTDHGLITMNSDKHITFLIPKDNPELFQWLQDNCITEYKVLKKTRIGWRNGPTTWKREEARRFTKEQIETNLKDTYPKEYILDDE